MSLVVFFVHVLGKHEDYSLVHGALCGVGGVVVALILLASFRSRKQHLPVLEWAFLQYYIFWISPVFLEGESSELVTFSVLRRTGELTRALLAVLLFMGAVLLGYALLRRVLPKRLANKPSAPVSEVALLVLAAISLFANYQIMLREGESLSYYYLAFVVLSPTLFLILFVYERANFKCSRFFHVAFYGFVVIAVLVGLTSGRLTYVLMPLVVVLLTYLARNKRIHWWYGLVALVMVVVINPMKIIYRDLTGFRTDQFARVTLTDSLDALTRSWETSWGDFDRSYDRNIEELTSRLNEQTKTAVVFHTVPGFIRFEGGTTVWPVFWNMVPRLLWKDKPNATHMTADYFNIKLGFQTPGETELSTESMPMVAEAYFNFGWPGVPLLGLVSGLILALGSWLFIGDNRVYYVGTFYVVVHLEVHSGFVSAFGGVWKGFLVAAVWCLLLQMLPRRARRRQPAPDAPRPIAPRASSLDRPQV